MEVVRDQVFYAPGDRQFQDMIIRRIRQVRPPAKINGLPDGRRAEVVQQRLSFRRRDRHTPPKASSMDQLFIFREQRGTHDRLVCPGKTPVQYLCTRAL